MTLSIQNALISNSAADANTADHGQSSAASATTALKGTEDSRVRQLHEQGQTPAEISVELSIPTATVNSDLFIGIPKLLAASAVSGQNVSLSV